ncbi:P-loop containing nucleoside triphosphate hydrolase protein [Mycena leptocephala]|nr:P-loop containing nucleoside triphosphate hydrolase protein [Mycena leptocephala]
MLPSEPKIFHGRNSELSDILHLFNQGTPRIAILGAGGMGKTSLARAIIHHTEITERYNQHRFFIACDSAATQVELAALIGAHVGLKPGKDLTRPVIQYFSSSSNSLLILDNLETLWEPVESRGKIQEFLSLLAGVDHLALVITMRGTERPAKVAWTHPFLPALKSLEQAAARQTFIDIADNTHDPEQVDKVLSLTDNLPLAISLIAHLVDSEGCSHVLSHWEEEKTSLISDGYDRTSNLDLSISLSLSSPRLNPHSKDLLSLLSMLPDGLSDVELVQSKLPIDNILDCKTALIRTSLAHSDGHKRLKYWYPSENTLVSNALEHSKEFDDPDLKCRFYNSLANYYRMKGDISSAMKFCAAAISLALSTGNTKFHSQGLYNLAWVEWNIGDYSAAQVHAIESQRLALISADLYREAQALHIVVTCCYTLGDYTKAMSLCIRARELLDLCGMSGGNLDHNIMSTQAEIHRHKSEYVEARSIHNSILEETSIQEPYNYGLALVNVTEIDVLIGAPKNDVQRNCDRARKFLDIVGYVEGVTLCDVILADLYLREGNSLIAQTICERCLKLSLESSQVTTYCLERLGDTSYWGDLDGISSWTAVFLVHSLKRKEKFGIYKALQFLGDIFLSQSNEYTAISLFTVALVGFTQMDVHRSRAECMLRLGDISMGHGDLLKAVEFWERAKSLFERSSQAKQVQCIDERVANITEDVLEQHRNKLACLAELSAPSGTVEELEDDLSDIEDLDKMDMGEENGLGLIVV